MGEREGGDRERGWGEEVWRGGDGEGGGERVGREREEIERWRVGRGLGEERERGGGLKRVGREGGDRKRGDGEEREGIERAWLETAAELSRSSSRCSFSSTSRFIWINLSLQVPVDTTAS